jgi:hypothetical protein
METEEAAAVVFTATVTAETVGTPGAMDEAAAERPAAMPPPPPPNTAEVPTAKGAAATGPATGSRNQ